MEDAEVGTTTGELGGGGMLGGGMPGSDTLGGGMLGCGQKTNGGVINFLSDSFMDFTSFSNLYILLVKSVGVVKTINTTCSSDSYQKSVVAGWLNTKKKPLCVRQWWQSGRQWLVMMKKHHNLIMVGINVNQVGTI